MLTPYSLDYAARISVLLHAVGRAAVDDRARSARRLRDGGWRYPALFALVVQVVGGVNATALLFAGLGPALWVAVLVARRARRAVAARARRHGADRRAHARRRRCGGSRACRSRAATASTSCATPRRSRRSRARRRRTRCCAASATGSSTARTGSGRGSRRRRTTRSARSSSSPATRSSRSRCSSAGFVRWRHRAFFVALLLVGVVIAVGAHPYDSPTPLGAVFKAFATRLDRRARDAQHRARGAARRARDRGAARRRRQRRVRARSGATRGRCSRAASVAIVVVADRS